MEVLGADSLIFLGQRSRDRREWSPRNTRRGEWELWGGRVALLRRIFGDFFICQPTPNQHRDLVFPFGKPENLKRTIRQDASAGRVSVLAEKEDQTCPNRFALKFKEAENSRRLRWGRRSRRRLATPQCGDDENGKE